MKRFLYDINVSNDSTTQGIYYNTRIDDELKMPVSENNEYDCLYYYDENGQFHEIGNSYYLYYQLLALKGDINSELKDITFTKINTEAA